MASARKHRPDRPDIYGRRADEVRSIFGDLEIVEAKTDFVVYVNAYEQENSQRGDPNNCMFSNACKRAFGSKGVLFYPTVAYVDMVDPADFTKRIVMRFALPRATRQRLENFDMGVGDAKEAAFVLKGVPKTRTLAYMAKDARRRTKRKTIQDTPAGVAEKRKAAAAKGRATKQLSSLIGVRNGSGQVHTR